jgi:hypothetical protein
MGKLGSLNPPMKKDGQIVFLLLKQEWREPRWVKRLEYRLHPHNNLIQLHRNGTKIQYFKQIHNVWVYDAEPKWHESWVYRVKPETNVVYEYLVQYYEAGNFDMLLSTEDKASEEFQHYYKYIKTNRSWEI